MTLNKLDLDRIEGLARAATPGPWHVTIDDDGNPLSGRPSVQAAPELDCAIVHWDGFVQEYWRSARGDKEIHANAAFIAALDPQTVLALIDMARRSVVPSEKTEPVAAEHVFAEYEGVTAKELAETVARYGQALTKIASFTQTERLLWWQELARDALRGALPPQSPLGAPTNDMIEAGIVAKGFAQGSMATHRETVTAVWRAMLAAAPIDRPGADRAGIIEECAKVAFDRAHDNHKKAKAYEAEGDEDSQLSCMTASVEAMEIAAAIRSLSPKESR